MLDQNTDRGSWAMIALVVAGVALVLVKAGSNEIGASVSYTHLTLPTN